MTKTAEKWLEEQLEHDIKHVGWNDMEQIAATTMFQAGLTAIEQARQEERAKEVEFWAEIRENINSEWEEKIGDKIDHHNKAMEYRKDDEIGLILTRYLIRELESLLAKAEKS